MNKPKLKDIGITTENYREHLKIGDKVWVDEGGESVATVVEFDDRVKTDLKVKVDGDCDSWPWLYNIHLIDNEAPESHDTTQFKAMKIRIKDEEHSRLVQETLFGMGCGWDYDSKTVKHTGEEVLWVDDGTISYSDMSSFNEFPNKEMELVTSYSLRPIPKSEKDLQIEALQKQIEALQEQLNELKND